LKRAFALLLLAMVPASSWGRDLAVPTGDSFARDWDRVHFDHTLYDAGLRAHVNDAGLVDYAAIGKDAGFQEYLYRLANTDPAALAGDKARLAFWINAYNALVIQGVLQALPPKQAEWTRFNVLEVTEPGFEEPGKGFFRGFRFMVGGRRYALDEIEHGVLLQRDEWVKSDRKFYASVGTGTPDPRIHFALVCAAKGCVKLRRGAYTSDAVDEQLDAAIAAFARDEARIRFDRAHKTMQVSQLLDWYGGDLRNPAFVPHAPSVPAFLADYVGDADLARSLRRDSWTVTWIHYDWSLNLQP